MVCLQRLYRQPSDSDQSSRPCQPGQQAIWIPKLNSAVYGNGCMQFDHCEENCCALVSDLEWMHSSVDCTVFALYYITQWNYPFIPLHTLCIMTQTLPCSHNQPQPHVWQQQLKVPWQWHLHWIFGSRYWPSSITSSLHQTFDCPWIAIPTCIHLDHAHIVMEYADT